MPVLKIDSEVEYRGKKYIFIGAASKKDVVEIKDESGSILLVNAFEVSVIKSKERARTFRSYISLIGEQGGE